VRDFLFAPSQATELNLDAEKMPLPDMTGDELKTMMREHGLKTHVLARIMKRSLSRVSAWRNGKENVPGYVVAFMQAFRYLDPARRQAFRAAGGAYRKRQKKRQNDVEQTSAGA